MSFVQAVDGRFYENPTIWGRGFYVHFNGDAPEVVIKRLSRTTPISGKARASSLLRGAGIVARGLEYYGQLPRYFPPEMDAHESFYYTFKLTAPIPVPNTQDTVTDEPGAVWDHKIYGFWSNVSSEDCAKAVLGMDIIPLISRALLAQVAYVKGCIRPEICKKLYAQAPWLRELKHETYKEQLKDKPSTVRLEWRIT